MSAIDPRVKQLVDDVFSARVAHLTPEHRREYLHSRARAIQVDLDQWLKGEPPDDRHWPIALSPEASESSRALTESGDSIAHAGKAARLPLVEG